MYRKFLLLVLTFVPALLTAQVFDFDLTQAQPVYNEQNGYGYDLLPAPNVKRPTADPFYFSVRVPDGNYRVHVTLGGVKGGNTTVRAEGRRLMMDNILTPKKKATQTVEFVVNKRSTLIEGDKRVKIKDREKDYLAWDDKLTLEFNGPQPAVRSIHIEPADVPTIYLCGNSTVVDQNYEPWASWGQMITRWFGPEVAISNHAESGLTARTFIASYRLDKILQTLKAGDYVFVEFGTQRRAFDKDGKTLLNTHGDFPAAMKEVAQRENVPLIDLNMMTKTFFETLGFEDSKRALVHYPANTFPNQPKDLADNTHFNPYGAYEVAKCVVMGMKACNLPIVQYLRPDWQDFDPAQPDDWRTFQWAPSPMTENLKPDGN